MSCICPSSRVTKASPEETSSGLSRAEGQRPQGPPDFLVPSCHSPPFICPSRFSDPCRVYHFKTCLTSLGEFLVAGQHGPGGKPKVVGWEGA